MVAAVTTFASDGSVVPDTSDENPHTVLKPDPDVVPPEQTETVESPFDPPPTGNGHLPDVRAEDAEDDADEDSDAKWKHDFLDDFYGDRLAIRKPTQQALAGFSLASSKYVSMETKNDITGLFISRHLSPESYGRVFSRLMDPDDETYTVETIGELMKAIVTTTTSEVAD